MNKWQRLWHSHVWEIVGKHHTRVKTAHYIGDVTDVLRRCVDCGAIRHDEVEGHV